MLLEFFQASKEGLALPPAERLLAVYMVVVFRIARSVAEGREIK